MAISGPPTRDGAVNFRTFVTPGADVTTFICPNALELAPDEFVAQHRAHLGLVETTLGRWFRLLEVVVAIGRLILLWFSAWVCQVDISVTRHNGVLVMVALLLTWVLDRVGRRLIAKLARFVINRALE